jgi:hypothetical protein
MVESSICMKNPSDTSPSSMRSGIFFVVSITGSQQNNWTDLMRGRGNLSMPDATQTGQRRGQEVSTG